MSEEIKEPFNYDNTNDDHMDAINEVLSIIKARPNVPISFIEEEIKQKLKIENIPERDLKQGLWYHLTEDFIHDGMNPTSMGHVIKVEEGHKVKVPLLSITADLDKLNEFATKIIMKIKGEVSDTSKTSK